MHRINLAFAVILSMVIPVLAQDDKNIGSSESECADRFKVSDLNNDNVLTPTEIRNAQQLPRHLQRKRLSLISFSNIDP